MAYQVLARKWRPQVFETVVGQDAITRTLQNALVSTRLAHAYLFAGPRGVGKTTTARLLAKALLCGARTGAEPCAACPSCQEVTAGVAMDVIEIDGASNRGIDDVRTLRENVKYAPARGRFKVYIIDEVHQLTPQAFDALLKTLEEPPSHVVFILATTDPRDIPPTVLSRVQRFDFKPIPAEILSARLSQILTEEGIAFDPAALPLIIRAAEGSLRDALSLLDTALAYGSGKLEAEATAQLLGTTAPAQVRAFAAAMLAHDAAAALGAIDRAANDGEDLAALMRETIELLRRGLVVKAAPAAVFADLTASEMEELRHLVQPVSVDELLYLLRAFLDGDAEMRESPHPRVELEIAAVRAARRPVPTAIDELLRKIDEVDVRLRENALMPAASPATARQISQGDLLTGGLPEAAASVSSPAVPLAGSRSAGGPRADHAAVRGAGPPTGSRSAEGPRIEDAAVRARESAAEITATPPDELPGDRQASRLVSEDAASRRDAGGQIAPDLAQAWKLVVEDVMRKKMPLGSILDQATPVDLVDGQLIIKLEGNPFYRERLTDRANRDIVVQAIRRCVAGASSFEVLGEFGDRGRVLADPAVQAALEHFGGEIVSVRPRAPEGDGQ